MQKNQLLKGFQDFLPEVMIPRQQMIQTIIGVFELYGFVPQDTPALEYAEVLMGKYGEDEKLIYRFEDNGGREVALRYDLTVPLARVVAMYRNKLPMPYKRYQISKVWRADKPQRGRFREFVQFDADTVGSKSPIVDAEMIAMMCDTMKGLGVKKFLVRVNDRRILNAVANAAGVPENQRPSLFTAIDKIEKIGKAGLTEELKERGFNSSVVDVVNRFLSVTESKNVFDALAKQFKSSKEAQEAISNLKLLFTDVASRGFQPYISLDLSIARGLSYYTGTIYETTLIDAPEFGSVISGGRYDQLIQKLGGPDLPAVGTSVGVDRLFAALQKLDLLSNARSLCDALIVNFTIEDQPIYGKLAQDLRSNGISCEIYPEPKKVLQQFQYAEQLGIPFVLLLGEKEKTAKRVTIRQQSSRSEQSVSIDQCSKTLLNLLQENNHS